MKKGRKNNKKRRGRKSFQEGLIQKHSITGHPSFNKWGRVGKRREDNEKGFLRQGGNERKIGKRWSIGKNIWRGFKISWWQDRGSVQTPS